MKLTTKVIAFSIGMLAILALSITIPSTFITYRTQKTELKELEDMLRNNFDEDIKSQVQTAYTMLEGIYQLTEQDSLSFKEAEIIAAHTLRGLRYGKDGYFWADTKEGVNVVLLGKKDAEGKSRWDAKDARGKFFIREIIKSGLSGDGFTEYWFPKAGTDIPLPKRSYTTYFEPFNWVIGTGNYIDYKIRVARTEMEDNLRNGIILSSVIAMVMLVLFGLLSVTFSKRLTKSIITLSEKTKLIAKGNLDIHINATQKDEIGVLQSSLKSTLQRLREVIQEVIEGAGNVFAASEQMAQTAEHISNGANSQAASTEEISTSAEEMVANIQSNSENAKRTETTANKAGKGIEQLQETVNKNFY